MSVCQISRTLFKVKTKNLSLVIATRANSSAIPMQRKKYVSVMLGICFKPKMLALAWIEALPKVLMGLAVLLNSKALLRDM